MSMNNDKNEPQHWIWVFDDAHGLQWVIEEQQMAFSCRARTKVKSLRSGDRAILYMTGNASPAGLSRVRGYVTVLANIAESAPIQIPDVPGRSFCWKCPIHLDRVLTPHQSPALKPIVSQLELIEKPEIWGQYLRGSPVAISRHDFEILAAEVESIS